MIGAILSSDLLWVIVVAFGLLGIGTVLRLAALRGRTDEKAKSRRGSLKTWWCVTAMVVAIAIIGRNAAIVVFALISLFAFLEFMKLKQLAGTGSDSGDANTSAPPAASRSHPFLHAFALLLIPVHYLCLWLNQTALAAGLIPVAGLIGGAVLLILGGQAKGYVSQLGHTYLGLIFTTYFLSHVVLLFQSSASDGSRLEASAWFLFVVALTETDDIAQALVGRRVGKRRLAPNISPNKTWEGLLGGVVVTMLLSILLGHFVLSVTWLEAISFAVVIATAGLFGDLNISAVKRDAGVKDSGSWLPGHGGLLDRVDSLTFTAPVFYYVFVRPMWTE